MARREQAELSTPAKRSLMLSMAEKYGMDPVAFESTLMNTVMPDSKSGPPPTREQVAAFMLVAEKYNLNPFVKEIYAFPSRGGIVPMIGFDGFIQIAERHAQMDGLTFEDRTDENGKIVAVTCRVWRKDRSHPTEATEYLVECRRSTDPWDKMPNRMLRNKAAGQAIRMAFGVSGVHDEDDARAIEASVIQGQPQSAPLIDDSALDEFAPQEITPSRVIDNTPKKSIKSDQAYDHAIEQDNQLDGQPNPFDGFTSTKGH